MDYRERIRHEARQRSIQYLVHFTQAWNLSGIVTHGLLSRTDLVERGLDALPSDRWRLDERDGAISVSISAINYEMFRKKQANCGRADWVALLLDPSILWSQNCRFYARNAASRAMKEHRGFLGGHWGFSQMFMDSPPPLFKGTSYRTETCIPDFLTTWPDAEVQVLEPIAPENILHAWVERRGLAEAVQAELNRLPGPERDVSIQEFNPWYSNGYSEWGVPAFDMAARTEAGHRP